MIIGLPTPRQLGMQNYNGLRRSAAAPRPCVHLHTFRVLVSTQINLPPRLARARKETQPSMETDAY